MFSHKSTTANSRIFDHPLLSTLDFTNGELLYIGGGDLPSSIPKASIKTITIHPSIISIEGGTVGAFAYLPNLKTIIIPDDSKLEEIGECACEGCESLDSISNIPASCKRVGKQAFSYCTKLTSVVFSEGSKLEVIGKVAFENCHELILMSIPEGCECNGDGDDDNNEDSFKEECKDDGDDGDDDDSFKGCTSLNTLASNSGYENDVVLYLKSRSPLLTKIQSLQNENYELKSEVNVANLNGNALNLALQTMADAVVRSGSNIELEQVKIENRGLKDKNREVKDENQKVKDENHEVKDENRKLNDENRKLKDELIEIKTVDVYNMDMNKNERIDLSTNGDGSSGGIKRWRVSDCSSSIPSLSSSPSSSSSKPTKLPSSSLSKLSSDINKLKNVVDLKCELETIRSCTSCFENKPRVFFLPCHHLVFCKECAERFIGKICPIGCEDGVGNGLIISGVSCDVKT